MNRTATIQNQSMHDMVSFDLVVDGNTLDSSYQVIAISVKKEVNRIPSATIILRDGEAADGDFALSNSGDFIPGKAIEVKIGRDSDNTTVFVGIIVKHRIKVRESGEGVLIVECKDKCVSMSLGRHNRYFEDSKDSDVMEQLIGGYRGLDKDVEATTLQHAELIQHHCTDWDFLLSRAEVNGRLVIVDDGKVQVKKPDTSAEPALSVAYGTTLLEFEAEMDARTQWRSVEAQAWDYSNQDMFIRSADAAPVSEPGNLSGSTLAETIDLEKFELRHSGQLVEAELQAWTDAAMLKSRLAKVCGRAKFFGFADIKPGQLIELQGVGDRFNGKAFVSAVRHDVGNGAWDTHVQFGMPLRWFHRSPEIMDVPAAGLLPGVQGLQIGKVVQLQDDPNGEHRILVRLPIVDNSAPGIWARIVSLDAGEDRGAFFRPEIDDEVVVGFVNGDPRDSLVLGMLHSRAKPAPLEAQDDNHEKGFQTRSKMRVLFNDETKTITIDTPAGNSIVLDEDSTSITIKDQNDNKVVMDSTGIGVDSPKDIKINAGGKIEITATGDLSINAAKVAQTAQGSMEVKGATSKLEASGITEVKGSLVKIN
ncbi:type VI secretion system tip protein VgrG [Nitrosomonas sp.]|uniref:type VI secretion system tip protein VgrG n=1 Tax=Nitrosomonas sp. TaxID=42353 RepID=UPI002613A57E|nr:type VI secretion system tip protein VgrG [Nitrosomonas sp.]MCW5599978.1 type VI secretion system tip protein VgrG [Nitrosomonas sp.]